MLPIAWLACTAPADVPPAGAPTDAPPLEAAPTGEAPAPPIGADAVVAAPTADDATPSAASALASKPPTGFVDLSVVVPGVALDVRYHTPDNFTGAPLPGYGTPNAWLREVPAQALARVQAAVARRGWTLVVYDAYRPLRATLAMVAWAKRTDQVHLLDDGYVSRRSGHNRGNTIDLSVRDRSTGAAIDMGTPWDTLSEASHTRNASGTALEHRLALKSAMEAEGFRNYWKEWWHYTFVESGEPELAHRDVPYGCFEAAEGSWAAPAGWSMPGWVPPANVPAAPCVDR